MIGNKTRYKSKAISVYGEPNHCIINTIISKTKLNSNSSILIPNANDGLYVLPLTKKFEKIECYESNKALLTGGKIESYVSLGLYNRLEGAMVRKNVYVNEKNYYDSINKGEYDLVIAIRTLQLKENNNFTVVEKLNKLKSNVKRGGYLYLNYYIGNDNEIDKDQVIKYNEIKKYFKLDEWEIIYFRDNYDKLRKI